MPEPTIASTAAGHLSDSHSRGVCVIDDTGRLVGVATRRDLLRVYLPGDHRGRHPRRRHPHRNLTWHSTVEHARPPDR